MSSNFGEQTASGHLHVPSESKEPYPTDVLEQLSVDAEAVIARYPQKRSALLPLLHLVQSVDGYVTGRGIDLCAELLDLSTAEVSGVATFYTQYKRHPNGTYTVGVCTNTLCAIMGGDGMGNSLDHIREIMGTSMEALIHHFKLVTEGFRVPPGQAYVAVESAKGELGCHTVSDGGTRPYRAHFRDPSFNNLQATAAMCEGSQVADVIVAVASIDPVMGGVDR